MDVIFKILKIQPKQGLFSYYTGTFTSIKTQFLKILSEPAASCGILCGLNSYEITASCYVCKTPLAKFHLLASLLLKSGLIACGFAGVCQQRHLKGAFCEWKGEALQNV